MTDLYLRFQDKAQAVSIISSVTSSSVEDIPAVGEYNGSYWEFYLGIPPLEPTGDIDLETGEPVMRPQPGVWIVGRWRGSSNVPVQLEPFFVDAWGQIIG